MENRDPLQGFHEPTRRWFTEALGEPTRAQELGWPAIQSGSHTLLLAPTGSGKTLAAFLTAIDHLLWEPGDPEHRCRVLYISPLKALAVDVERNLRRPLAGITEAAAEAGERVCIPEIVVRTGDTPARERTRFQKRGADVLITTPESLFLILTSAAREQLRSVHWVIIDEIHSMVASKRGVHLTLSLERLAMVTTQPFQRIGLSATQRPLDEVARFLGGYEPQTATSAETAPADLADGLAGIGQEAPAGRRPRPVNIVDAGSSKPLDLRVDVAALELGQPTEGRRKKHTDAAMRMGAWPAILNSILDQVRQHRSTLIFVNGRRMAERVAGALNELAGRDMVQAHHGSVSKEQRLGIEAALKLGKLPALVATSTLELGIDMGAIDLVIQLESPPSVASAMQRIGRAGHQIGAPSKGIIVPKFRGDLPACAAVTARMHAGLVEEMRYPRNCLDVLAQQVVAMVATDPWTVDSLAALVACAAPYAGLPRGLLEGVIDMLSGRYPSDGYAELKPRITWDRMTGNLTPREGARHTVIANAGAIPDRGLYGMYLQGADYGKGRVGELEEIMVHESRVGDVIVLGASSWRIQEITHDRVVVSPAPGVPGRMPFWHGEGPGRPLELGRAIGALIREVREVSETQAITRLRDQHDLTEPAAADLLAYLQAQADVTGAVPDDRTIVVERHRDEMGDWRICILSHFGARVHAPWAMAIGATIRDRSGNEPDILWTDSGIVVRLPDTDTAPPATDFIPPAELVNELVIRQLAVGGGGARKVEHGAPVNAVFASRFREAAARALLLPHRKIGQRSPLWQQRKRAADLLHVTGRYGSFPIILETYREILRDVFDMPALAGLLAAIDRREVRLVEADTIAPSPFACSMLFSYVASFMYEGDAPLAERKAQALTVDQAQLRELMGEIEFRDLLDPAALVETEEALQHLAPHRRARSADGLHDILLWVGDLASDEIAARCDDPEAAGSWARELEAAGRIVRIDIGGAWRYIAVEDAARYRDAVGVTLPPGIPTSLLAPAPKALQELVGRFSRTHGPFTAAALAGRLGTGTSPILSALGSAAQTGRVLEGEFRPGGSGTEWCDAEVLRMLRRKSLAALRREVEPVEQAALARFAQAWHGISAWSSGPAKAISQAERALRLREAIGRLQGVPLVASSLEPHILAARIPGYDRRDLDQLLTAGEVLWVGAGPLAPHDGRVRLLTTEMAPYLLEAGPSSYADDTVHGRIRAALARRGAQFYPQLLQSVGGFPPEVLEALWDLAWAGEVTNDTLQPLREYVHPQRERRAAGQSRMPGPPMSRYRPSLLGGGMVAARPVQLDAVGRWSLVSDVVFGVPTPAERAMAGAQQLLDRHGVIMRDTLVGEEVEGGFASLYGTLQALEDGGRVRRGYFVEGLGAAQFALPHVVDQLREKRERPAEPTACLISATDPANPYGSALPWPATGGGRQAARMAGGWVALVDGMAVAWIGKGEKALSLFDLPLSVQDLDAILDITAQVLATGTSAGPLSGWTVERIDGVGVRNHPFTQRLLRVGFTQSARGLVCTPANRRAVR